MNVKGALVYSLVDICRLFSILLKLLPVLVWARAPCPARLPASFSCTFSALWSDVLSIPPLLSFSSDSPAGPLFQAPHFLLGGVIIIMLIKMASLYGGFCARRCACYLYLRILCQTLCLLPVFAQLIFPVTPWCHCYTHLEVRRNQLHNLQGPMQHENVGPLFKNY